MALSTSTDPPDERARTEIRQLADRIEASDGAPPLSDQALSLLGAPDLEHVVVRAGDRVVGYAQRADDVLELAADPHGLEATLDAASTAGADVWSHGRQSRLVPALERRGFVPIRELFQLRRPLDAAHPLPADPPLAAGIRVREFEPGRDDDAWLAVNAAAFAEHAEQGRWTAADLRARMAEPWFDPDGFLLAERAGDLLGYHWTKIHDEGLGEVYVLGIAPDAQGLGLGKGLLIRGLRYLSERDCPAVLLYVDGDNMSARRLYERAGFVEHDRDVQWRASGTT